MPFPFTDIEEDLFDPSREDIRYSPHREMPFRVPPQDQATRENIERNMNNDYLSEGEAFTEDPDAIDEGPEYGPYEGPTQGHIYNTDPRMPENFPQMNRPNYRPVSPQDIRYSPNMSTEQELDVVHQAMSPEQMIDSINRLLQKGMPRDDETIRTLEDLIAQELAKPPVRDDDFLRQNRPEVGRPTYQQDPNARALTPEDWEAERRMDQYEMDITDMHHMYDQFRANPNPEGYRETEPYRGPIVFQGQSGSPDLPSAEDIRGLEEHPTDAVIMDFLNAFGVERAENPRGRPAGEVPMPRPRQPDMQEGVFGPYPRDFINNEPEGNFRATDFMRRFRDPQTTEMELDYIQENLGQGELDDIPKRGEYDDEDDRIYPRLP